MDARLIKFRNKITPDLLINDLPEELVDVEDKDLGNPDIMSPMAMGEWIESMKSYQ